MTHVPNSLLGRLRSGAQATTVRLTWSGLPPRLSAAVVDDDIDVEFEIFELDVGTYEAFLRGVFDVHDFYRPGRVVSSFVGFSWLLGMNRDEAQPPTS